MDEKESFKTEDPFGDDVILQEKIGHIIENVDELENRENAIEEKEEGDTR